MIRDEITQCRGLEATKKSIVIDFLYIDLHSCERRSDSATELDDAVLEVGSVMSTLGLTLSVNKVEISTPELAEEYRFVSSPTFRVNGRDICAHLQENACEDCSALCGSDVECRVFEYEGKEYSSPPKAMIINAVLREIHQPSVCDCVPYIMPENLRKFYDGKHISCCETAKCGC